MQSLNKPDSLVRGDLLLYDVGYKISDQDHGEQCASEVYARWWVRHPSPTDTSEVIAQIRPARPPPPLRAYSMYGFVGGGGGAAV